jgi:hypothetical protein
VDSLVFGEIAFVHYGKPETNLWRVSSVVLESVFIGYGYVEVEGIPTEGLGGKGSLIGALVPHKIYVPVWEVQIRPERPGCDLSISQ